MYYDKQIHYIDYLENGEKKYNCGYVKITVSGGRLVLEMQIKGLYETDDVAAEVMLEGAGMESRIGSVMILQGGGSFRWEIRDPVKEGEEMSVREGLRYGQLERIHVRISPRRSLLCVWKAVAAEELTQRSESAVEELMERPEPATEELMQQPESAAEELAEQPVSVEEKFTEQSISAENKVQEPERIREKPVPVAEISEIPTAEISAEETQEPVFIEEAAVPEQPEPHNEEMLPEQDGEEEPQTRETQRRLHGPRTAAMSEDKWRQLWKIYPHIRPFRDEREYLSLWPEDFVVLRSDAYRLSHNSFLLHGYYNYEHLILTQMSVNGTNRYYIGVPGNFYEKEKQVAIMFGFESFECRQEPAQEGDFGYYMIRVEL